MTQSSAPQIPSRAFETPVPSPCTSVCRINPENGFCEGCWRTIDEIIQWSRLSDDDKRAVWREIERRRTAP